MVPSTWYFWTYYPDRDQAVQLISEIARISSTVQVVALLPANEPDLILRCLRAGAVDFLMHPFTADQMEAALGKLSRSQPAAAATGKRPRPGFSP